MDDADRAQQQIERAEALYLRRRTIRHPVSRAVCIDCADVIPPARRDAVPGCVRCAFCEHLQEVRR